MRFISSVVANPLMPRTLVSTAVSAAIIACVMAVGVQRPGGRLDIGMQPVWLDTGHGSPMNLRSRSPLCLDVPQRGSLPVDVNTGDVEASCAPARVDGLHHVTLVDWR